MIFLGRIKRTRSTKGELVCELLPAPGTDIPQTGDILLLKSNKRKKQYKIASITSSRGLFFIKFENINSIDDAYRLLGYSLYKTGPNHETDPGNDIVGFQVKDTRGKNWGNVQEIVHSRMHTLIKIADTSETYMVPFHPSIVIKIIPADAVIIIDPPKGLMDLNTR